MAVPWRLGGRVSAEEEFFAVDVALDGNQATVAIKGEVDVATAPQLWDTLESLPGAVSELVLGLDQLTFMDSTGIRVVVRAHELMKQRGGALVLQSPDAATRKLLEITSVDKVITIRP